jgi:arginase
MKTQTILTPYFLDEPLKGLEEIKKDNWIINQEDLPKKAVINKIAVLHEALARYVSKSISNNTIPVSIAGDCCTAIGVLAGLRRAGIDPLLIWFDAHGDFNTWETTPSGFLGGMPLAMIAGLGEQTILDYLKIAPLPQEHIILSDGRDLDPGERELVEGSDISHLKDPNELLNYPYPDRPMWVHFDTDVLDPADVPAQNYPAPGGPSKGQLAAIFDALRSTDSIKAVSLSSWAPDLPGAENSAKVCMKLLTTLCQ